MPLIVVPLFADQHDNAEIVGAHGVGAALGGGAARVSSEAAVARLADLTGAVSSVLGEPRYAMAARALAAETAALPTVDAAGEELVALAG